MSREEVIKGLLKDEELGELRREVAELKDMFRFWFATLIVTQKDACEIAGITDDTIRNMALRGEVEPLQADGSTRNYYTLETVKGLKPRRQRKK